MPQVPQFNTLARLHFTAPSLLLLVHCTHITAANADRTITSSAELLGPYMHMHLPSPSAHALARAATRPPSLPVPRCCGTGYSCWLPHMLALHQRPLQEVTIIPQSIKQQAQLMLRKVRRQHNVQAGVATRTERPGPSPRRHQEACT